jgi:hypothetical protein
LDALSTNWAGQLPTQGRSHTSGAIKRRLGILDIDQVLEHQRFLAFFDRGVVEAGSTNTQQFTLSNDADLGMAMVNQLTATLKGLTQIFFSTSPAQP